MFGLEILDVAIGVVFVFLLVSILVSALREGIEALMRTRGAYLWLGIRELLHDKNSEGLANAFREHPLIYSLFPGDFGRARDLKQPDIIASGRGMPSYIPSRNFAVALMDIAARGPLTSAASADASAPVISLEAIRANIANVQNPAVQRVLLTAIDSAQGDLGRAQAQVEAWFNSAMDRVSGWYKRSTHWWLFWIGLIVAVGMNVNTLLIVDFLYRTPKVREAIVQKADAYIKAAPAQSTNTPENKNAEEYDKAKAELQSLHLPIGWSNGWKSAGRDDPKGPFVWNYVAVPIAGWLLTAFAATFGAPFWFDILNKIMVIRSTVKPHEKSLEEGSEDRQPKAAAAPAAASVPAQPLAPAAVVPAAPPPAPSPQPLASSPADDIEADLDSCVGDAAGVLTSDEDLPAAVGGVR